MSLSILLDSLWRGGENSAQHLRYRHIIIYCLNDVLYFLVTLKILFAASWLLLSFELILIEKHLRPDSSESMVLCDEIYFACLPHFTSMYLEFPSAGL